MKKLLIASIAFATLIVFEVSPRAHAGSPIQMTAEELELQQMSAKIKGMVDVANHLAGLSLRCQTASDCVPIAMGSRACGGPTSYIFTSKLNPSMEAAMETAALVTKAEKEVNAKFRRMSICSFVIPPDLTCVENTCGQP